MRGAAGRAREFGREGCQDQGWARGFPLELIVAWVAGARKRERFRKPGGRPALSWLPDRLFLSDPGFRAIRWVRGERQIANALIEALDGHLRVLYG